MESVAIRRNSWVACPKCGHKVAKVRTCDMELKCRQCGHEFEAVIGPAHPSQVREEADNYKTKPNNSIC